MPCDIRLQQYKYIAGVGMPLSLANKCFQDRLICIVSVACSDVKGRMKMLPKNARSKDYSKQSSAENDYKFQNNRNRSGIKQAIFHTIATLFFIMVWRYGLIGNKKIWGDWLAIAAILILGPAAILSWLSYFRGPVYQEKTVSITKIQWVIFTAISLTILGLMVFSIGGWALGRG